MVGKSDLSVSTIEVRLVDSNEKRILRKETGGGGGLDYDIWETLARERYKPSHTK